MALFRGQVIIELPQTVEANNVLYFTIGDAQLGNQSNVEAAIVEWLTDLYNQIAPILSDVVTVARVLVYLVDTLTGDGTPYAELALNVAGTDVSEMIPHGVSAKVDVSVDGRSRPSSSYIAGMGHLQFGTTGLIAAGALGNLIGFGMLRASNYTATNGIIIGPVLWSNTEKALYSLDLGTITVNNVPDYQRRRKPGVGS